MFGMSENFNDGNTSGWPVIDDQPRDVFSPRQRHTLKEFACCRDAGDGAMARQGNCSVNLTASASRLILFVKRYNNAFVTASEFRKRFYCLPGCSSS